MLANLPFSLIGSLAVIAVTGIGLAIGPVARPWNMELALRGANERLIPILMTAVVTTLGLAPLVFGIHRPGQEIEGPMAITVLGGLVSSTLLNLVVLPTLALRYVRRDSSAE